MNNKTPPSKELRKDIKEMAQILTIIRDADREVLMSNARCLKAAKAVADKQTKKAG